MTRCMHALAACEAFHGQICTTGNDWSSIYCMEKCLHRCMTCRHGICLEQSHCHLPIDMPHAQQVSKHHTWQ